MFDRSTIGTMGRAIVGVQESTGAIPWERRRHCDPWDHVEAAMGLDVAGLHRESREAYEWLKKMQAEDGSWAASYVASEARDHTLDSNFIAYAAVGVWHHYLSTRDDGFLVSMWPMVDAAMEFVMGMQMQSGAIMWARDPYYKPWPGALLAGSSSIYLSLRCAITMGERLGWERPEWELALARLGRALRDDRDAFESKDRFAMDWYYPVLSGALSAEASRSRILDRWNDFVIEERGTRCVLDRDWVTTGETCELAIACEIAGLSDEAGALLGWIQYLRADDGMYWTGANHPGEDLYPLERTTWSAGAVLLAAAAVEDSATRSLFTGTSIVRGDLYQEPEFLPER